MKNKNLIFLIGFMGSGKTSLAKKLAKNLALKSIDSDLVIKEQAQCSISEIFNQKGEHYFRDLEQKFLKKLDLNLPQIISCGGGLPCFHDHIIWMKKNGMVLWLDTNWDIIYSRLKEDKKRPLAQKLESELKHLFHQRKIYYQLADYKIKSMKDLEKINFQN